MRPAVLQAVDAGPGAADCEHQELFEVLSAAGGRLRGEQDAREATEGGVWRVQGDDDAAAAEDQEADRPDDELGGREEETEGDAHNFAWLRV